MNATRILRLTCAKGAQTKLIRYERPDAEDIEPVFGICVLFLVSAWGFPTMKTLFRLALLVSLTLVTSTSHGDSYEEFLPSIVHSASGLVTVLVQPLPSDVGLGGENTRITVCSRYATQSDDATGIAPIRQQQAGSVNIEKQFVLGYHPFWVRASESNIALVDKYVFNRKWLDSNPAIRISRISGNDEILIKLPGLVSDISACAFVSDTIISWCHDAWFSKDGRYFYVVLSLAKKRSESGTGFSIAEISVVDGKIKSLSRDLLPSIAKNTEGRFHSTLFDVARFHRTRDLQKLASKTWKNDSLSLRSRVHAAAYCAELDDPAAEEYVRHVASLLDHPDQQTVAESFELKLKVQNYLHPVSFAMEFLRLRSKSTQERKETDDK